MVVSPFSFRPPTLLDPYAADASSTSRCSGFPDWVLLDKVAYFSDRRNATTAESWTAEGQDVEVSFWLVDPPGVSYFTVHCPGLKGDDFRDEPRVISVEGALVLFRVNFTVPRRRSSPDTSTCEYFVYRAGPWRPSLVLLPDPDVAAFRSGQFGLFPCGNGDSKHYAVAFLSSNWVDEAWQFVVHIFLSETGAWSNKPALLGLSPSEMDKALNGHETDKLIIIGEDSMGWVDLWRGIILLCKLFDKYPVIQYIPLPEPRVLGMDEDGDPVYSESFAETVRNVACCNGLIKFVEVEFCDIVGTRNNGWTATTWNRMTSWNDWGKCFTVDVDNISVDPSYSALLPELWDDKTKKLELKKLISSMPILSMHNDNLVYMISKVNKEDKKAWIVCVDMEHSALEALAPFPAERFRNFCPFYFPCAFSKYLNVNSGADMVKPMDKYFKSKHLAHCVLEVLLTQDWFRELDKCLDFERSYNEFRSLLRCCPASSLHFNIQARRAHPRPVTEGRDT